MHTSEIIKVIIILFQVGSHDNICISSQKPATPKKIICFSLEKNLFCIERIGSLTAVCVPLYFQLTLTLKNVSSCIRQCRALPVSTPYFSLGLGKYCVNL